ncbi:MAG: NTP transferase domain-containing protein [Candidatus Bathyarchaeia archaeon]
MGITALVMAGGKGTRMGLREEKPLLKVGGKPMIEHVLTALKNAEKINGILVAVSKHTPRTAKFLEEFPIKILETPGEGYVSDIRYAIKRLKLGTVLTISVDLPLITGRMIDLIIEKYIQCNKPALTVTVPVETKERLGLRAEHVLESGSRRLVPAGINVIDGRRIDEGELEEEILVIDEEEVAVNVNTPQELRIAESLFLERLTGEINHLG